MNKILAVIGLTLLLAGSVFAQGSQVIIKQHAKDIRDQNNARQGVTAPQPATPATAPAAPVLSPALSHFQTELGAVRPEAPATAEQKKRLSQDLLAGAQVAKPSLAAATRLTDKLTSALGEKPLSPTNRARLVQELDAVLNPGKYPQAKLDGIYGHILAMFQENGLSRSNATAIVDDVKAISGEIQAGGAK